MAKPDCCGSVDEWPHQKNVHSALILVSRHSLVSLVSLSAAASTLYLARSLATSAVPLSGCLVLWLSHSILRFTKLL